MSDDTKLKSIDLQEKIEILEKKLTEKEKIIEEQARVINNHKEENRNCRQKLSMLESMIKGIVDYEF